jgi:tetratricopeptide (TPR) repeat protein
MGREYRSRGDLEAALTWYRAGAKLCPRDFEAQFQTGLLLLQQSGDYAAAEKLLAKAVKLNPKHLNAHFALGEALLAQEKRDEAKEVFQKIVDTIDAQHTPSLLHLAKLNLKYDEQGVAAAEALYEQAKTLDPERPETYRKLAELYHAKGQHAEEQEALEKFLKLSSSDPDALRQLADLYIRRGDYAQAEGALRRIIALDKADKRLYTLLGEVMVQARAKAA